MPARYEDLDVVCDRKGRFSRFRFARINLIGTPVSGSEEEFRIRYNKGFYEFGFTGTCTMPILTMIFKILTPDWLVIIDLRASRDASNVFELPTLTTWEADQDAGVLAYLRER
jgi:hypothetical protein